MTRTKTARLILDGPASGPWNMAVDEALLDSAGEAPSAEDQVPVLRFYQWSEATVSLGYFQSYPELASSPLAELPVVRRSTGGGAIVHDRELTYSLIVPDASIGRTESYYGRTHAAIAAALAAMGLHVIPFLESGQAPPPGEPLLCFARRTEEDLVAGPHKIVGSAQRRRRGVLLQHGSILLAASPHVPQLSGAEEVADGPISIDSLRRKIAEQLAERLSLHLQPGQLDAGEFARAELLAAEKFAATDWTCRR